MGTTSSAAGTMWGAVMSGMAAEIPDVPERESKVSGMQNQAGRLRAVLESILILYFYFCLTTAFLVVPPLALKSLAYIWDFDPEWRLRWGAF